MRLLPQPLLHGGYGQIKGSREQGAGRAIATVTTPTGAKHSESIFDDFNPDLTPKCFTPTEGFLVISYFNSTKQQDNNLLLAYNNLLLAYNNLLLAYNKLLLAYNKLCRLTISYCRLTIN